MKRAEKEERDPSRHHYKRREGDSTRESVKRPRSDSDSSENESHNVRRSGREGGHRGNGYGRGDNGERFEAIYVHDGRGGYDDRIGDDDRGGGYEDRGGYVIDSAGYDRRSSMGYEDSDRYNDRREGRDGGRNGRDRSRNGRDRGGGSERDGSDRRSGRDRSDSGRERGVGTRDRGGGGRGGRGNGGEDHGFRDPNVDLDGTRRGPRRGQRSFDRNDRFDLVRSRPRHMEELGSKKGTSGAQVALIANFFPLKKKPMWCLYNYRVDFKPDEERTPIKKALLKAHASRLGGFIFDGSTMWTAHKLSEDPMILYSVREADQERLELTIRLVQEMSPGDVTYLQFYNIIVRKCLQTLNFEELGRHFYDRNAAIPMPQQRLELWPGYITTMRNYESRLMLCVEVTHKVLRLDNCLSVISGHRGGHDFRRSILEELVGSVVMTHYNRKTYKIDDIDWDKSPSSTFDMRGEVTSYAEYYRSKYQIQLTDLQQPMLVSRPKKRDMHRGQTGPIFLVPELCQMTGLTDQIRSNFNIMRELARHLHQPPDRRIDNIRNFMRRLRGSKDICDELERWGLEFDGSLVNIPGRVLPKDQILMVSGGKIDPIVPDDFADWKYAFRNKNMFSSKKLDKWVILVSQRDSSSVDNLIRTMTSVGRTLGFMVHQPLEIFRLPDTRIQAYINAINQAMANNRGNIDIIFAILPGNKLDLYAAIKKRCCIDFGIPSQCFLGKNMNNPKGLMSIATKVVIQMNAKMGGEPWAVSNPLKASHTMVVGFDVYHCGKRKGASVGAMVATTNKELSKYYSTVSFHNNREELSGNLCTDITKCLFAFRAVNQENLPDRIIMFRDGVGEGQLTYVYNTELEQMKTALLTLYTSANRPPARFTLIIVTKKINARIVTAPTAHGTQSKNPGPGTIVDDIITLPERWDFYLISQHVNQGTVSPTSYNVIWDQQGLDPDKIQRFTFKMTHMYYNWSGTVAVPAPCQYAHKLAYLTGLALGNASNDKLSHCLYYL